MKTAAKKNQNTQTLVVSILLLTFVAGIWILTFYVSHILRQDMQRLLSDQQASTVAVVASDINSDMTLQLQSLEAVAAHITPELMTKPPLLQEFLENRQVITLLFNAGVFVTDAAGTPIADVPVSANRLGLNVMDRDYMVAALKEGRSSFGKPVLGKSLKTPVFSAAAPIYGAGGRVIGAIVGVTSLGSPNFLDRTASKRFGKSGGYLVIAPQQRQIVTATDKKRIMEVLPPPGVNSFIDRAINGFEGSGITTTPHGIEVLVTTKSIPASGWYVVALLPTNEAFSPIKTIQQELLIAAILITLVLCSISWWLVRAKLDKRVLEQQIEKQIDENQRQSQRFRTFIENASDFIYSLTPSGIISYVAPNVEDLLGYLPDELTGRSFEPLVHPDDLPEYMIFMQYVMTCGVKHELFECRIRHKDGTWLWFVSNASSILDSSTGETAFFGIGHNINERKQIADRLKSSEQLYHSLVETSQDLIWQTDEEGTFTYQNLAWEHVLGYELHEMKGRKFHEFQSAEEGNRFQNVFSQLLQGESVEQYETVFIGKAGNPVHLVFNALYLMNNDGAITGASGTAYDITHRKSAEISLRESEEKYRILLEESSDAVFILTQDGQYKYVNTAFATNLGKTPEGIIGNTLWDVFNREEADKRYAYLSQTFQTGKISVLEVSIPAADGDRHYMTTITPVFGADGNVQTAICSSKDVTQLKSAEISLREMTGKLEQQKLELQQLNNSLELRIDERTAILEHRTRQLETMLEATVDGILMVDIDGKVLLTNQRFREIWQIPHDINAENNTKLLLKSVVRLLKNPDEFIRKVAWLFEHHDQISSDEIVLVDGRCFDMYSAPLNNNTGDYFGRVWLFRDLTDKKKLHEQLLQSQKLDLVGKLAGGIAHDFNNKLSVIMGYTELAREDLPNTTKTESYLLEVMRAAEFSRDITSQLLAFSRQQITSPRTVDVNIVIANNLKSLSRLIGEDIRVIFKPYSLLWTIRIDPVQLEQTIMNLSVNARDAMDEGGTLTIETANYSISAGDNPPVCYPYGDYVMLSVSDTGTGMTQETLRHIFEPFFTTKEIGKGTGLGLATVHGIVSQNGGHIDVKSSPGAGTTFRLLFTRHIETVEEAAPTASAPVQCSGSILLVEDEDAVRNVIARLLENFGYTVTQCATPFKALELYSQESGYDMIVTDIVMPGMNGREMVERLEQSGKGIKVLYLSGHSDEIITQKGVLIDQVNFLQKPVNSERLRRKISAILSH